MKRILKWTGIGVGGFFALILVVAIFADPPSENPSKDIAAQGQPTRQPTEVPATPTAMPTATPEPGFGDGMHIVGTDIQPGIYRSTRETGSCYWARLGGFGGEIGDINANGNGSLVVVEIAPSDEGFESSRCNRWVPVELTAPTSPMVEFGDGTYVVGMHIEPGTYRSDASSCYWARMSDFSHEIGGIISNGNGPTIISIAETDAGFIASRCGTWMKVG